MQVTIAGAGTMGHALALVHALAGCRVRLQDIAEAGLEKAEQQIEAAFELLVETGAAAPSDRSRLGEISYHTDLPTAIETADLFIETVTENPDIKRNVFQIADTAAPMDAIFTSNTSFLDVFPLIPERRLTRCFAVHWYAPAYVIDLVDIAPSPIADPSLSEKLVTFYEGMGKVPVLFDQFLPGYIANRVQAAITREVFHMLDERLATPEQIDQSLRHGLALRMAFLGHVMRSDFTGLPLVQANLANGTYHLPPDTDRSGALDQLIERGDTGIATGRGFYDYGSRDGAALAKERDSKMLSLKSAFKQIGPIDAKPAKR